MVVLSLMNERFFGQNFPGGVSVFFMFSGCVYVPMHSNRVMAKLQQTLFVGTCGRHSFWVAVEKSRTSQHCLL